METFKIVRTKLSLLFWLIFMIYWIAVLFEPNLINVFKWKNANLSPNYIFYSVIMIIICFINMYLLINSLRQEKEK